MADAAEIDPALLAKFAQKLAGNEKKYRDRAVKNLKKWMSVRSQAENGGFSEGDFMKIWKGLHYCMWMSDKPLVQMELASTISELIHCLQNTDAALLFIRTFFLTQIREWFTIDRLRLDKYMTLIRKFLRESFVFLKRHGWEDTHISQLMASLSQTVISPNSESAPESLKLHIVDIYLVELIGAGGSELSEDQMLKFLDPYCVFLTKIKSMPALHRVVREIFFSLISQSVERLEEKQANREKDQEGSDEEEDEIETLKVNNAQLADRLFTLASDKHCRGKNRKHIYSLVKTLRNLAQGILPEVREAPEVPDRPKIDYGAALQRLSKFEKKVMQQSGKMHRLNKKRQRALDSHAEKEEEASPSKKAKKDSPVNEGEENDVSTERNTVSNKKKKKQKIHAENPAKKARKEKLKAKKQSSTSQVDADQAEAVVLNAGNSEGGAAVEESENQPTDMHETSLQQILSAMKKKKTSQGSASAPLFAGGFVDSDDDQDAHSPTTVKAKKKLKAKTSQDSVSAPLFTGGFVDSDEDGQDTHSPATAKTKKKKKKVQSPAEAATIPESTNGNTVEPGAETPKQSKSPKKSQKAKSLRSANGGAVNGGLDSQEDSAAAEEVEIFVPNKKYKGPMKAAFEQEMKKSLGSKEEKVKKKKKKKKKGKADKDNSNFATFLENTQTPPAFVRKALLKVSPKSDSKVLKKTRTLDDKTPNSESNKKRRVSFVLDQNRAQEFEESLTPSPVVAFDPKHTPNRTILKSSPSAVLFKKKASKKSHLVS